MFYKRCAPYLKFMSSSSKTVMTFWQGKQSNQKTKRESYIKDNCIEITIYQGLPCGHIRFWCSIVALLVPLKRFDHAN